MPTDGRDFFCHWERRIQMSNDKLWDSKELADFLGLASVNAARIMVSRGQVPFIKIGQRVRFHPDQIHKWLEEKQVDVTA